MERLHEREIYQQRPQIQSGEKQTQRPIYIRAINNQLEKDGIRIPNSTIKKMGLNLIGWAWEKQTVSANTESLILTGKKKISSKEIPFSIKLTEIKEAASYTLDLTITGADKKNKPITYNVSKTLLRSNVDLDFHKDPYC